MALRSTPIGRTAESGLRHRTLTTSLERAEQFFRASASIGYEARPVTLFYGLSQLGRAIAASAYAADEQLGSKWQLKGHGIRVIDLERSAATGRLGSISVRDNGAGSFTQLCRMIESASLPEAAGLVDLLALVPELRDYPLSDGSDYAPPLDLREGYEDSGLSERPAWVVKLVGVPLQVRDLRDYLRRYPGLRALVDEDDRSIVRASSGVVYVNCPGKYVRDGFALLNGTRYRVRNLVFPDLFGGNASPHPIAVWWAALYSLSMLARYEPVAWAGIVNVDKSPDAVPVERLLDSALDAVPQIAYEVILHYSDEASVRARNRSRMVAECTRSYMAGAEIVSEIAVPYVKSKVATAARRLLSKVHASDKDGPETGVSG